MSLFIAICDDEREVSSGLESILINILDKLKIEYEIDVYFTGEEVCQKISDGAHYDLMFLDIEFLNDAISGIEVGTFIRENQNNNSISIVYISGHMKFAMQLFDIRPLNFLIKPLDYNKVKSTIETYLKLTTFWSESFTYKIGHDTFKVKIRDIIYLESFDRKLILHLSDGRKEEFYGTLKTIYQEQLEKFDFLFIHASYVVNYDYVTAIKYDELTLVKPHTTLPIGQARRKEIRNTYISIMEKRRK